MGKLLSVSADALQWGHDLSVVESSAAGRLATRATRFNGATTSRSWNRLLGDRDERRRRASMGPRPLGRGIRVGRGTRMTRREGLQWGHDLSVVESLTVRMSDQSLPIASMGPRPLGRGILLGGDRCGLGLAASMGPRPLGRGIPRSCRTPACARPSFNGATTSRSWNPDGAQRVPDEAPASMGPRPLGRGIGPTVARPSRSARSFNGATTSRSWNPPGPGALAPRPRASMGPRPLGRGITPSASTRSGSTGLQWGHDLSVVESEAGGAGADPPRWASMGPRPLGRGICPTQPRG